MLDHGIDDQAALVRIWLEDKSVLTLDYVGTLFGVVPPTFALFRARWMLCRDSPDQTDRSRALLASRQASHCYGLSPPVVHFAGLRVLAVHSSSMHEVINPCQGFLAAVYNAVGRPLLRARTQGSRC